MVCCQPHNMAENQIDNKIFNKSIGHLEWIIGLAFKTSEDTNYF